MLEVGSSSGSAFANALRGLNRLQRLWLAECAFRDDSSASSDGSSDGSNGSSQHFASVVRAIASLPELRDLRLADLPQWDQAATAAL
jgi:hypothetical protein